jgi:hypothetical protein
MAPKKGQTNNPKGRPKGTPNKVTSSLRDWIIELIDGNRNEVEKDLKKMEPKDRLIILERLIQYVVPKQQSFSIEAQIQAEYEQLKKLLEAAPDEVVERLAKRINELKKNEDEKG